MSQQAVEALRAEREELLALLRALDDAGWAAPSGCEGWRVQDVVTHIASGLELAVDPANAVVGDPAAGAEARADAQVDARTDWTPAQALAFYEDLSARALDALGMLQTGELADTELDMGDLGRHPMHLVANAFAFDAWTHRHEDLLAPRGPIDRPAEEPTADRMAPIVEWLLAGLPFMSADALGAALAAAGAPIVLRLEGPAGGEWTIVATDGAEACTVAEGASPDAVATVTSGTVDFVRWSTHRVPWRSAGVTIAGDEAAAERVLDAIHLF